MPEISESESLVLESRNVIGKKVKYLRAEGKVPAVIHNHGKESINVQGEYLSLVNIIKSAGKHHPVELSADGKNYTALIKTISYDPKKHLVTHVVFNAVNKNQTVDAEIPIHPKYDEPDTVASPAERSGLLVLTQLESIDVKALPGKLPDFIEYDAEKLVNVGDHILVSDLIVGEGIEVVTDSEHAVATVYEPSAVAASNEDSSENQEETSDDEAAESKETSDEETKES